MERLITHETKKVVKFIRKEDHSTTISQSAIDKIFSLRQGKENYILRIEIDGGGCQGFQYKFISDEIANIGQKTRDIVIFDENKNLLVVFDVFSEFYIKGAMINYISNLLESGFKIEKNPNSKSSCGCNKSFSSDAVYQESEETDVA